MNGIENELWDVYRFLLSKGASATTARDALLALARDLMSPADDYTVREAASRIIAKYRKQQRSGSEP
jgi:hypothetical protein